MRLSETLYERKKIESKILKSMEYRRALYKKRLEEIKDEKQADRENRKKEFEESIKKQILKINSKIDAAISEFTKIACEINSKNIDIGLDKKLYELKFLRIELSSLNKLSEHRIYSDETDYLEKHETYGIDERLEAIEERKRRLDNNIQQLNFTNEIKLQSD